MANDILITSWRGGMNDSDLPVGLGPTQCANAMNVEFWLSALGERRLGCMPIPIDGSFLDGQEFIAHLSERLPDNDINTPEHWGIGATITPADFCFAKQYLGIWQQIIPKDDLTVVEPEVYHIQSQALNGKLFFSYLSDEDRLHVWDGTSLRRTGLAAPSPAPVVTSA